MNGRLSAIKSLIKFANKLDIIEWTIDIEGEKIVPYRDVSGVSLDQMKLILESPDRNTTKGKRDYAILRILWENALRRGEITKLNIGDFDTEEKKLFIIG